MSQTTFQTVLLKDLLLAGDEFLTYTLHPPTAETYISHPAPVVTKTEAGLLPLSGHDRLLGAKDSVTICVADSIGAGEGLAWAARDIAWFRPLTDAEKVTAIGKYTELSSGNQPSEILAAALGLEPTFGVFDSYARVWQLGTEAMEALYTRRLSLGCGLAISDAPKLERKALLYLFTEHISPNLNTARRIAENAVAAALMRESSVKSLLTRPEIIAVLKSELDGPKKISALDKTLFRLRYPELSEAKEEARQAIADLDLPKSISVSVPATLEPGRVSINFSASSESDLEDAIEEIKKRIGDKRFRALFRIAGK